MVKITFVEHDGSRTEVDARPGMSMMKNALAGDVAGVVAECGGNAACGTCRVYVPEDWRDKLPAMKDNEREMVDYVGDSTPGVRLSCQIKVTEDLDGLEVRLPEDQRA